MTSPLCCSDFLNISKEVTKALKNTGYLPDVNGELSLSAGSKSTNGSSEQNDEMDSAVSKSGSASPEPMKESPSSSAEVVEAT